MIHRLTNGERAVTRAGLRTVSTRQDCSTTMVHRSGRWVLRCFYLGLVLILGACAPADVLNLTVPTAHLNRSRTIPYGSEARQRLDVYRPAAGTIGAPTVVFLYGGGWESGTRDWYLFIAAALATQGLVVVVPDYRVYPAVRFPTFVEDAAQVVRWTAEHAAFFGGDPTRLILIGHSAGAHIAALLALDRDYLRTVGVAPERVAGVVGLAGPYDFLPLDGETMRAIFAPAADLSVTQPITFANGPAPPMLLATGTADTTVLPANSERLAAALAAAGNAVCLRRYPGLGHIGIVTSFAHAFRWRAPVLDEVVTFIANTAAGRAPCLGLPSSDPGAAR